MKKTTLTALFACTLCAGAAFAAGSDSARTAEPAAFQELLPGVLDGTDSVAAAPGKRGPGQAHRCANGDLGLDLIIEGIRTGNVRKVLTGIWYRYLTDVCWVY